MEIKETKELAIFLFSLIGAGVKSIKDDGKITPSDLINLLDPLKKLLPAIENANEILPELRDLDSSELEELLNAAQKELGFGQLEDIEDIVAIVRHGLAIYQRHK